MRSNNFESGWKKYKEDLTRLWSKGPDLAPTEQEGGLNAGVPEQEGGLNAGVSEQEGGLNAMNACTQIASRAMRDIFQTQTLDVEKSHYEHQPCMWAG